MKAGAHEHLPTGFAGLIDVVKRRSELLFNTTLPRRDRHNAVPA